MEMNRTILESKISKGRYNLLLAAVLSLVNIILVYVGASLTFPFSASLPMIFVNFGNYYTEELSVSTPAIIGVCAALVVIGIYVGLYLLSKKSSVGMILATIFFCVDTLILLGFALLGSGANYLLDIAFHAWVLYYLFGALSAYSKLKKLPIEAVVVTEAGPTLDAEMVSQNSDQEQNNGEDFR